VQTVALHTRLKAGSEEGDKRIHKVIPPDLDAALREAGVHDWRIWRDGQGDGIRFVWGLPKLQ
jgi:L-rhamnose mutarotase